MGTRPSTKNLQNKTRAIDDLRLPAAFEVTLLHRAEYAVDDNQTDLVFTDHPAEVFEGPPAEKAIRARPRDPGNLGANDVEVDGPRETDRFLKPSLDGAARCLRRSPSGRRFQRRVHHKCTTSRNAVRPRCCV